jgi:hypothetical protein
MNYSRKKLLALPQRCWDTEATYNSIALVPTGKKHGSGYALIAIVGFDEHEKHCEIAAYCDDVSYSLSEDYVTNPSRLPRTDMLFPSGITHVWARHFRFKVGSSLSSTEIYLVSQEV